MHFADFHAVTIDGYGTLLHLVDPTPGLRRSLAARGIDRTDEQLGAAFRAEVTHYRPRAHEGRDPASLAALRLDCVKIFLGELCDPLAPQEFVDDFIAALVFEPVPGAVEAVAGLRARGLRLGVVANWDCALPEHLAAAGLAGSFDTVVTSARAGTAKPDPAIFELALRELGVKPEYTVHVGDEPIDEEGALAAGLAFAPAPLRTAFEGWS
jgi:HAD superfamily hydrolase (TIGR01509 family)